MDGQQTVTGTGSPWGRCVICRQAIFTSYVEIPAADGSYSVRAHDSCFRRQQAEAERVTLDDGRCALCHKRLMGFISEVPSADGELGKLVHLGCWQRRQAKLAGQAAGAAA